MKKGESRWHDLCAGWEPLPAGLACRAGQQLPHRCSGTILPMNLGHPADLSKELSASASLGHLWAAALEKKAAKLEYVSRS